MPSVVGVHSDEWRIVGRRSTLLYVRDENGDLWPPFWESHIDVIIKMAEGERFELSEGFHLRRFSRPVL